jgi:hypothetical protein
MHYLGHREANGSLSTTARSQACKTVGTPADGYSLGRVCCRPGGAPRWGLIQLNAHNPRCASDLEIIEILCQEHRNIEKLLQVMEEELTVFDRGERPDYEVFGAIVEFFKKLS